MNPQAQLHIHGQNDKVHLQLTRSWSPSGPGLPYAQDVNYFIINDDLGDDGLQTVFIFDKNKRLGIQVDEPLAKLHMVTTDPDEHLILIESPIANDIQSGNKYTFMVAADGKTYCREAIVDAGQWPWPDYVFEEDYELMPLNELEEFVNTEKHLPEIPSEADVKENGINIAEMNALLLKKVEELTLHVIELNKEVEALKVEDEMDDNVIEENDAERIIEKQ